MRLILTPEQAAGIEPLMKPGFVLMGRITRLPFDGTNAATSGALVLEAGAVIESALPGMRAAIHAANQPKPAKRRKACDEA